MKALGVLVLAGLILAGCGSSGRTTKSCVTEIQNADGSSSKIIAHVDVSDPVSGSLCEGDYASAEEVTAAMFGKTALVKAPATKTAVSPKPAPVKTVAPAPAVGTASTTFPQCRKTMVGGTGYACVSD